LAIFGNLLLNNAFQAHLS